MRKCLISKALIGLVTGPLAAHVITLLVNYFSLGQYLVCMPELTDNLGLAGAVVAQTVLGAIFGMVAVGGMCFFEIEGWSLLRSSAAHCSLILVSFIIVGLQLRWLSFHLISILIMASIIFLVYTLIWLIMYVIWKKEIREMNRLAEEYKKDVETSDC